MIEGKDGRQKREQEQRSEGGNVREGETGSGGEVVLGEGARVMCALCGEPSHSRLGHSRKFLSKLQPVFLASGGAACGKGTKVSRCISGWSSQFHLEENSLQLKSNPQSPGSPEVGHSNQTGQNGFPGEVSCVGF